MNIGNIGFLMFTFGICLPGLTFATMNADKDPSFCNKFIESILLALVIASSTLLVVEVLKS